MHGKAVKIRHCPATVSGQLLPGVRHCIGPKPMWEGGRTPEIASQETGSAAEKPLFSEGKGSHADAVAHAGVSAQLLRR